MSTRQPKAEKPVKNLVRVIYRPRAGKAKRLTRNIDSAGMVTINDGRHTVSANAMFPYLGKKPWCVIHQDKTEALSFNPEKDALGPQFLNEAVSNHYAGDVLQALEEFGKDNKKEVIIFVMLGFIILIQFALGLWAIGKLDALNKVIELLQTHAPAAPTQCLDATVCHA